jgi:hypothetical protein
LDERVAAVATGLDEIRFRADFASASRRLGTTAVELTCAERAALADAAQADVAGTWTIDGLARAGLLCAALVLMPAREAVALVAKLFRSGGLREQEAILRALPLLPDAGRHVEIAVEATRVSALSVFAALAQDNPYPARHFPDLNFNQLVLKVVFVGLPVARLVGLADRATPELARMVHDFASERRAAGRAVPDDVAALLALAEKRR